jgi:hypothetical protein
MRLGPSSWLLALVMACVPGAPDTETPDDPPPDDPPSARLAPSPSPAPESFAAMCADLDDDDEKIRIRIVDALDECKDGVTRCSSAMIHYIANCSDEPVEVQNLALISSPWSGTYYDLARASNGSGRIAPRTVWSLSVGYFNDPDHRLRIDIVNAYGAPIRLRSKPVRVSNPARLAVLAACEACEGIWDHRSDHGCNCKTRDVGQACDDDDACAGQCLFDHWQISTPTPGPRCTGKRCTDVPPGLGRPIGRCSEYMSTGDGVFLEAGIAALPDQPVPWGVSTKSGCVVEDFLGHPKDKRR